MNNDNIVPHLKSRSTMADDSAVPGAQANIPVIDLTGDSDEEGVASLPTRDVPLEVDQQNADTVTMHHTNAGTQYVDLSDGELEEKHVKVSAKDVEKLHVLKQPQSSSLEVARSVQQRAHVQRALRIKREHAHEAGRYSFQGRQKQQKLVRRPL